MPPALPPNLKNLLHSSRPVADRQQVLSTRASDEMTRYLEMVHQRLTHDELMEHKVGKLITDTQALLRLLQGHKAQEGAGPKKTRGTEGSAPAK